jgi:hypothetical protein
VTVPVLDEQRELMTQAKAEICGGYLDFVYALDPGGALVAHSTPAKLGAKPDSLRPDTEIVDVKKTYRWRGVRELIERPNSVAESPVDSLTDGASAIEGSALGLIERPSIPIGDRMSDLNPLCDDWNLNGSTLVWPVKFVQSLYPLHPVFGEGRSCQEGKKYCNHDSQDGIAMRQWCSSTCGCGAANSSLILSKDQSGCPNACTTLSKYQATLAEPPCIDHPSSSLVFKEYVQGLRSLQDSYQRIGNWYVMFGSWIENLENVGCAGHILTYEGSAFGDLCGSTAFGLKPISNVCPQTCKCSVSAAMPKGQPPLCPIKCQNVSSR